MVDWPVIGTERTVPYQALLSEKGVADTFSSSPHESLFFISLTSEKQKEKRKNKCEMQLETASGDLYFINQRLRRYPMVSPIKVHFQTVTVYIYIYA